MNSIYDFIQIALPWVAIVLLFIVFFLKNTAKDKNGEKLNNDFGTEGMCLGMCVAIALKTSFDVWTGIIISLGMLMGFGIGICIKKEGHDWWNEKT